MAKQVVWSVRAQSDRKQILQYWKERNNSTQYSKRLNYLFKESIKLVARRPKIGKPTSYPGVRVKIVRDYFIVCEETDAAIQILTI